MDKEKENLELKNKIKKPEERLNFYSNSCSGLQTEEFQSHEQDRIYLNILKNKLKNFNL